MRTLVSALALIAIVSLAGCSAPPAPADTVSPLDCLEPPAVSTDVIVGGCVVSVEETPGGATVYLVPPTADDIGTAQAILEDAGFALTNGPEDNAWGTTATWTAADGRTVTVSDSEFPAIGHEADVLLYELTGF